MCSASMQREMNVSQKISKQQTQSACFNNVMKLRQIGRGNISLWYASFAVCSHYLPNKDIFYLKLTYWVFWNHRMRNLNFSPWQIKKDNLKNSDSQENYYFQETLLKIIKALYCSEKLVRHSHKLLIFSVCYM